MKNSAEYMREYMRGYRRDRRDTTRVATSRMRTLPFVGVDGEGGNEPGSDYHAYWLLRVGSESIRPTGDNVRLTTTQCLDFLCDQPRDAIYVVYFGDYDVTKMLEDMPWQKLTRLINRKARVAPSGGLWPVDWMGYEIDYLPRKEFKVRRAGQKTWFVLSDVGSFFQTSFVEAIKKWDIGTDEERDLIAQEKARRGQFVYSGIEDVDVYNRLEIRLLEMLMEKFRDACETVGYIPSRWQGPGLLAEAMYSRHGVPRTKDVPLLNDPAYRELLDFARNAFYGGRPEISVVGPVDRPVTQGDINSAYPYAMLHVPCLVHGKWEQVTDADELAGRLSAIDSAHSDDKWEPRYGRGREVSLRYGTFRPDHKGWRTPLWYGLPFRSEAGTIIYPGAGKGWYWDFEIRSAVHQTFDCDEAWIYRRTCDCEPLSFVADVYVERQRIGKDGPGIVLKLGMNSLYGKSVQSIGMPKYANPIWGSFITAWCRTMIQDFIHGSEWCDQSRWCGLDVVMVATDSVCTWNSRADIVDSTALGGWSREEHPEGMFIVQPGLYFGSSGKRAKTRGIPLAVVVEKEGEFRAAFDRMAASRRLADGDVDVPQRLFAGIRYSLHRRNTKLLGQWIEFSDPNSGRKGKTVRYDWSSKRSPYPVLDPMPGVRSYVQTFPQPGDTSKETVPYAKDIGGLLEREEFRLAFDGQPDWVQPFGIEEQ